MTWWVAKIFYILVWLNINYVKAHLVDFSGADLKKTYGRTDNVRRWFLIPQALSDMFKFGLCFAWKSFILSLGGVGDVGGVGGGEDGCEDQVA